MYKLIAAAALGTAALAGPAAAQDGPPRFDPLAAADANKDGVITKDEMLASVSTRFKAVDSNKDGKLTPAEREAAREAMMGDRGEGRGGRGQRFKRERLDANGDGVVSLAEQQAQAARRFDWVDTNKDGKIDQAERAAARGKMMSMRGKGRHGRHGPPPGPGWGPPPPPEGAAPPPPAGAPDAPEGN
ncbi:EF-hand domain-containing protein [Sphingomonas canadensis]|uniref:EF-hand domain-containing protein n=1 Tax=Sphingomonas canadensis TaxID=1219257 RepID=A0ABW3HBV3_9SPHN|nr:ca2+ sensor protein [Sphingomonas canadensis]MCW3836760.1 ca2+ sensor protein [Sphingomonas canadensis]